jgi:hypothetical protein
MQGFGNGFASNPFDTQQLIAAAALAATALFVASVGPGFPFRRATRIAAVALYGATFVAVLVYVALWSFGIVG